MHHAPDNHDPAGTAGVPISCVRVEFDDLSEHQRQMVDQHPLAAPPVYRHGGLPVRWVATFDCPPTCDADRLYEAIDEWATFYGLPLRRRLRDAA